MPNNDKTILALDVGNRRIGVAVARLESKLPQPLQTLSVTPEIHQLIKKLSEDQQAIAIVVGLPRNLDGEDTSQTRIVRKFVDTLKQNLDTPIYFQDEALTSRQAEQELSERGVTYTKDMVDALAATYILSDFIGSHPEAL